MWVVDTCVILDVYENDPHFGLASAKLLERLLADGLCVAPATMVELAPVFQGDIAEQKRFLEQAGVAHAEPWTLKDTEAAHHAWHSYVVARRNQKAPKRPIADILIGGFAANREGLVTRNAADFRPWFRKLAVREP